MLATKLIGLDIWKSSSLERNVIYETHRTCHRNNLMLATSATAGGISFSSTYRSRLVADVTVQRLYVTRRDIWPVHHQKNKLHSSRLRSKRFSL
jgi:hypothetical protein